MSKGNKTFIQIVGIIIGIPFLLTLISLSLPIVFGQAAPGGTGALRFVPQDAIVYTKPPPGWESNIGTGNELTNMIMAVAGSSTVTGIVNAAYTKLKGDKAEKKAEVAQTQVQEAKTEVKEIKPVVQQVVQKVDETREIQKEQAATTVKVIATQEKTLDQVYENMGEKANEINDKPEIRKEEIAKLKAEALKTTVKA